MASAGLGRISRPRQGETFAILDGQMVPLTARVAAAELLTVEAGGIVSSELSTTPRIYGPPKQSAM
jgi:hypothetical protein